jgi:hypothetical protein
MPFRNSNRLRIAAAGMLLWSALLALTLGTGTAQAASSGCRTDPIVVLTNGAQLQFGANISSSYSNVQRVDYTIHGPSRSAMLLVIYTDNPLGSVERVHYYADAGVNTYTVDTVVTLRSGSQVQVSTSALLLSVLHLTLARGSASGLSAQHIFIPLHY